MGEVNEITLKIRCFNLPGVRVGERNSMRLGIQKREEVVEDVAADVEEAVFMAPIRLEFRTNGTARFLGSFVHGKPSERFIYLCWGERNGDQWEGFGRAKLQLLAIPHALLRRALDNDSPAVFYDGPAAFLRIYTRRVVMHPIPGTHRFKRSIKLQVYISNLCDGIDNVRWVPKHGHTLVFGVSDVYGHAKLAVWSGGKRAKTLVRRRYRDDTHTESYELDGVSKDGRRVYYGYYNNGKWKAYRIALAVGSRPHRDYHKQGATRGDAPPVWDKSVILTGN